MHIVVADVVELRHVYPPACVIEASHQRGHPEEQLCTHYVARYDGNHKQVQVNANGHFERVYVDSIHHAAGRRLLLVVVFMNVRVDRAQVECTVEAVVEEVVESELQHRAHQRVPHCELLEAPGHSRGAVQVAEEVIEEGSGNHTIGADVLQVPLI